jgi:hypothetical protein
MDPKLLAELAQIEGEGSITRRPPQIPRDASVMFPQGEAPLNDCLARVVIGGEAQASDGAS